MNRFVKISFLIQKQNLIGYAFIAPLYLLRIHYALVEGIPIFMLISILGGSISLKVQKINMGVLEQLILMVVLLQEYKYHHCRYIGQNQR